LSRWLSGQSTKLSRLLMNCWKGKQLRLNLLIGRDSHKAIKETGCEIFTGLTHETVEVLRDPNAGPKQDGGVTTSPEFSRSVSEGEWNITSIPSGTKIAEWRREKRQWGKCLQLSNLLQ
jgi:hypothetical protein